MPPRGSIAQMMIMAVVLGLGSMIARGWLSPRNDWGESGPMAIIVLLGFALRIQSPGRWRRFGTGMSITALAASFLFQELPGTLRQTVHESVIRPIRDAAFDEGSRVEPLTDPTWPGFDDRPTWTPRAYLTDRGRFVIADVKDQGFAGLLQLPIILVGGLMSTLRWRTPWATTMESSDVRQS